jgi:oxaloacetate decarboxylase alpha subunit
VDPDVADRVLALRQAALLRDAQPVSLEGARARFGARISDEELLLRLTMPAEQVDAMRAAPRIAERPVPRRRVTRGPLVRLLQELERRPSVTHLRLERGDELVEWRRTPRGT